MNELATNRQVTIYALCDPDTNEVRYIGQTVDPSIRLRAHLSDSFSGQSNKDKWIRSLLVRGKHPTLQALAVVNVADADTAELDAIQQANRDGFKVLNGVNSANGGISHPRPKPDSVTLKFAVSREIAEKFERLAKERGGKGALLAYALHRLTR